MARVAGMAWECKSAAFTQIRWQFARKGLTLIERKTANSNWIAKINLNLLGEFQSLTCFACGAIRTSESNDNVENFKKNVAHDTLAVTL
jgi:hypothetical protein